jgi:transcriptional regulator, LysR family
MRHPSLRQLRTLVAVARHGNLAGAARELQVTPPAVSMQVRELEAALELRLFDRTGRGLRPTSSGEYLLHFARRILVTLKEAEDSVALLRGVRVGRVTVGMVSTSEYFLPRLLALFRRERSGVEFRLSVGNREQLVQQLHDREVDFAVMGRPPREMETVSEPFAANPLVFVAAPEHRLIGQRDIPVRMLEDEPFIIRESGSGTRAAMEALFQEHGISPPAIMEMSSNETIKQAVMANLGLSLLSVHTLALEHRNDLIGILDVQGLPLQRTWHLVHLRSSALSPAADAFRDFVIERGEDLIHGLLPPTVMPKATPPAKRKGRVAARRRSTRSPTDAE